MAMSEKNEHIKKYTLRLDSGSLIGCPENLGVASPKTYLKISIEEALRLNKANSEDTIRLRNLIQEIRSFGIVIPFHNNFHFFSTHPTTRRQNSKGRYNFSSKCLKILDEVNKDLGRGAIFFAAPVNKIEVPDYYNIITNPMDLGTIRKKLIGNKYESPKDFANDMRLVWKNCATYNKKGDYVERLGQRGSMAFENRWAVSGYSEESRAKRATAGKPAQKFEPDELYVETLNMKGHHKTSFRGNTKKSRNPRGTGQRKNTASAANVNETTAITVKQIDNKVKPMPHEEMQKLASALGNLEGKYLEDVIRIIRENGNLNLKEGVDIELDIGELNNETLWKLENYLKEIENKEPSTASGVFINKDSSSDSSSENSTDSEG